MPKIAKKNDKKCDFCRLLVIYLFVVVTGVWWSLMKTGQKLAIDDWWSLVKVSQDA